LKRTVVFPITLCTLLALLAVASCSKGTPTSPPAPPPQETATPTLAAEQETTEVEPEIDETGYILVDDYGADPFDELPDSAAIQQALGALQSGETLLFTSGIESDGYVGYRIDRTIFIVMLRPISDVTLRATDAANPALLQATADLRGFVIQLYSRARFGSPGLLDDITLRDLVIDGGRDVRACVGPDRIPDGVNDNWGSWVEGECPVFEDPWCNAGGITLPGLVDFTDYSQDYRSAPDKWTTGLTVDNLTIRDVECGTALGLSGAASSITDTTIDTAGEHTHIDGCVTTDPDGEMGMWSDGITYDGTDITVENNTVINASDVAIVFFGGKNSKIKHNTVISDPGNYGAFAGIAIHTWGFGDVSGTEIVGNTVTSESDSACGGIHAGINIGTHMWGGGCQEHAGWGTVGVPGVCSDTAVPPEGTLCVVDQQCQTWTHIAPGGTFTLVDNVVRGAQINFLIEGLDNMGTLEIRDNESLEPRDTDWHAASHGCNGQTWGPLDFVAHHPTIPGWEDQIVHCEW
jgi:parallel beta-helix repeat protein